MDPSKPASNLPYLIAVVAMVIGAFVASVLIIAIRPDVDSLSVVVGVFQVVAPTTFALLAFMKSQETHLSVNSRLSQFMEATSEASLERGKREGGEAANARSDQLAQDSKSKTSGVK